MHSRMLFQTAAYAGGGSVGVFGLRAATSSSQFDGPPWLMLFGFVLAMVAMICITVIIVSNNKKAP